METHPASASSSLERPFVLFVSNATGYRVSRIMHGVAQECRAQQLALLWRDSEYCDLRRMVRRPAGIVVWDKLASVKKLLATADGVPVVSTIGLTLDLPMPTVAAEPKGIADSVAQHLLDEGLRNFLFVGPKHHPAARLRAAAFEEALRRRVAAVRVQSFRADFDDQFWGAETERGRAFLDLLAKEHLPLGIFAFNDQIAASCMECVDAAGLRVPQDVAIVGVDDHPVYTRMYQPLSSVRIDYEGIGRKAVALIMEARALPKTRKGSQHFVGGAGLVVRHSSSVRLLGDEQIARAVSHIHEHYKEEITLEDLARLVGMSRTTFALRFRRAVNESPNQYLMDVRMQRAKLLLTESAHTVSEIAYRVGFNDPGYFARMFKRRFGVTAKRFRVSQK